jgi:hypothetical protein
VSRAVSLLLAVVVSWERGGVGFVGIFVRELVGCCWSEGGGGLGFL